jgi:co-chaperonin GroES (HSP10)|tara:strand:+ start:1320 stop:1769 length:450 start_codon:yes stop_codon:yes gene_type:complete
MMADIKLALEEKYEKEKVTEKKETKEKTLSIETLTESEIDKLPQPTGWRILVLPFVMPEKSKGGIIIAQESLDRARVAVQAGYVLRVGPLAYGDKNKFTTGPWCKEKEWVIFARYAGSRLQIDGGEIRILNDDEVLATVKDPEHVLHAI